MIGSIKNKILTEFAAHCCKFVQILVVDGIWRCNLDLIQAEKYTKELTHTSCKVLLSSYYGGSDESDEDEKPYSEAGYDEESNMPSYTKKL